MDVCRFRMLVVLALLWGGCSGSAFGEVATLDSQPSLISDHRAHRIGQLLTVRIYEQASSSTSAQSRSNKSLGVSGSLEKTTGVEFGLLDVENESEGQGTISREGQLVANITALVDEVLPGGVMRISGEQKIEFNNEIQHIRVSGLVRPEDISGDNIVLSTRLANSEITYIGDGLLGSRQEPGIITRFFNWLF